MFKRASWLAAIVLSIAAVGCSGSNGAQGAQGPQGPQGAQGGQGPQGVAGQDLTATAKPETCTVCHATQGDQHQSIYDQAHDASNLSATIDSVVSDVSSVTTVHLSVTYNGRAATLADLASFAKRGIYAVTYDSATRSFDSNTVSFPRTPTFVADPGFPGVDGKFITTGTTLAVAPETTNAVVNAWFAAGTLNYEGNLFNDVANVSKTFGTVDYVSSADPAGCARCHGAPFRKGGYRAADHTYVSGATSDFILCKSCHYETASGHAWDWQRLADDPVNYATTAISGAQKTKYAYNPKLMNDVHMSHAMSFPYPQSMSNCATCHTSAAQLAAVLDISNFQAATCRSCHPVTGPTNPANAQANRAPSLLSLMTPIAAHNSTTLNSLYANATQVDCTGCHGSFAPDLKTLHTGGYNPVIADTTGARYSDIFQVTINSAVQTANTLTISFSATKTGGQAALDPTTVGSITPTVLVGLYGYDTKDFIVDPHGNGKPLEYAWGSTTNPRFQNATYAAGTWSVDVGLGDWATMIGSSVTRFEIGVLPTVKDPAGNVLAVNAPSKTFAFKVGGGTLSEVAKDPIVTASGTTGCNACHDALATTFHTPDRGGNVVVCRLCHNVRNGAYHLEMQSRSIDSYVHAIHEFQAMDVSTVNFTDPVQAMRYQNHISSSYPATLTDCKSCHVASKFNPPANDKSLPGLESAAAPIAVRGGWQAGTSTAPLPTFNQIASNIGNVPMYVTGPASRSCGGCHRAYPINHNDAASLMAFIDHTDAMGYELPTTSTAAPSALDAAIKAVMQFFR